MHKRRISQPPLFKLPSRILQDSPKNTVATGGKPPSHFTRANPILCTPDSSGGSNLEILLVSILALSPSSQPFL